MSALPRFAALRPADARADLAVVLLGTGVVGGALLRLLPSGRHGIRLVGIANSTRQCTDAAGFDADAAPAVLARAEMVPSDEARVGAVHGTGARCGVVGAATGAPDGE